MPQRFTHPTVSVVLDVNEPAIAGALVSSCPRVLLWVDLRSVERLMRRPNRANYRAGVKIVEVNA